MPALCMPLHFWHVIQIGHLYMTATLTIFTFHFFANEWKAEHHIKTNHETIARNALDSNCAQLRDIKHFALRPGNAHIYSVSAQPLSMKHMQYSMIYVYGMFS